MAAGTQAGKSTPSAVATVKTASTTARSPGLPKAICCNRMSVTLTWAPPEDDGGTPILEYEAELQPKSKAAVEGGMSDEWVLVYQVCIFASLWKVRRRTETWQLVCLDRPAKGHETWQDFSWDHLASPCACWRLHA
jgi:hypothetical protein